jgi:hypothetical protein
MISEISWSSIETISARRRTVSEGAGNSGEPRYGIIGFGFEESFFPFLLAVAEFLSLKALTAERRVEAQMNWTTWRREVRIGESYR